MSWGKVHFLGQEVFTVVMAVEKVQCCCYILRPNVSLSREFSNLSYKASCSCRAMVYCLSRMLSLKIGAGFYDRKKSLAFTKKSWLVVKGSLEVMFIFHDQTLFTLQSSPWSGDGLELLIQFELNQARALAPLSLCLIYHIPRDRSPSAYGRML